MFQWKGKLDDLANPHGAIATHRPQQQPDDSAMRDDEMLAWRKLGQERLHPQVECRHGLSSRSLEPLERDQSRLNLRRTVFEPQAVELTEVELTETPVELGLDPGDQVRRLARSDEVGAPDGGERALPKDLAELLGLFPAL
jgi:hypothetical protein